MIILESTGDISVLHGDDEIALEILQNVIDAEELKQEAEDGVARKNESSTQIASSLDRLVSRTNFLAISP